MKFFIPIILLVPLYCLTGCTSGPSCISITPPRVNITTEKTVIERQIIGEYKELEKDAWTISSARTLARGDGTGTALMGSDKELFVAMKIREFHRGRIRKYKNEGVLGEAITGLIVYRPLKKYETNGVEKNILLKITTNENRARTTLFTRSLFLLHEKDPSRSQVSAFGILFADEQRRIAHKNDWIQEKNGRWIRK